MLGVHPRVSRSLLVGLAMLVATTACAACGDARDGGAGRGTVTAREAPATDLARARRALIRRADMPRAWITERGAITRLHCGRFQPFRGSTVLLASARITHEEVGVQERIGLYPTVGAAARALRRLDSRRAVACLRRELRRHVSDEAGSPAGPARLARAERLGPHAHARRYASRSVGPYGEVVGYIDDVHERVGRTVVALVLVSSFSPFDEALYERVVSLASRRVQTLLG